VKIVKLASGLLVAASTGCLTTDQFLTGQAAVPAQAEATAEAEARTPQVFQVQPPPIRVVQLTGQPAHPQVEVHSRSVSPYLITPGKEGLGPQHVRPGQPPLVQVRAEVPQTPAPKPATAQDAPVPAEPEPLPAPKAAAGLAMAPPSGESHQPALQPIHVPETALPVPRGAPRLGFWWRSRLALQECFLGFKEEFKAPPLGHWLYLHGKTMVANGDAARMVLYNYDFVEGCDRLNPRGKDQLAKIAALLPTNFCPVVIERIPCNPALAEARRLAVLNELTHGPFPVPPERVVIGPPLAVGLAGREATIIYPNLLEQTRTDGRALNPPTSNVGGFFQNPAAAGGGTGGQQQSGQQQ
jgi:hypothetical protein